MSAREHLDDIDGADVNGLDGTREFIVTDVDSVAVSERTVDLRPELRPVLVGQADHAARLELRRQLAPHAHRYRGVDLIGGSVGHAQRSTPRAGR